MNWFTLSSEKVSKFECPTTSSPLVPVFISNVYVLLHLYLEVSRYLTFNTELKLSPLNQVHFTEQSIPHLLYQLQLIFSLH